MFLRRRKGRTDDPDTLHIDEDLRRARSIAADPKTLERLEEVLLEDVTAGDDLKRLVFQGHQQWTESLPDFDAVAAKWVTSGYLGAIASARVRGNLPVRLSRGREQTELIRLHSLVLDEAISGVWEDMVGVLPSGGVPRDLLEAISVRLAFVLAAQFGLSPADVESLRGVQGPNESL